MGKSGKIRQQDNSVHFSEDFPYSASVIPLYNKLIRGASVEIR